MIDALSKYKQALAAFATPGGRWSGKGALTYWGKAAGLSADEIVSDARAAGVIDRDADIRSGWDDARPKFINGKPTADYVPRAKTKPLPKHPQHVRNLIKVANADHVTFDDVRRLSPCRDWIGEPPAAQTDLFLRAAFRPDERLFVFRDNPPTAGVPWLTLRPAADWIERLNAERLPGDHIVPNPFSGVEGKTTAGKPSFVSKECLAAFPFLIVEFDAMPLEMQCAFWLGFIKSSKLSAALVALIYSGNKSIHGLLNIGCKTLLDWQATRNQLLPMFATDPDPAYRADPQAMNPRTGTRLPGVTRCDNGRLQELVYLNPRARNGTMWSVEAHQTQTR